jgi:hypothetical protein
MLSKFPGLQRTLSTLAVFTAAAWLLSCSNYNSRSRRGTTSGLRFRAFVSNPVHPNIGGGGVPALDIVDASRDLLSPYGVSLSTLSANVADAGMMALSPNHDRTLVMSPRDSKLAVVDNVKETVVGAFALPGPSESFFISSDNNTLFVAIPSAPVSGQAPGMVEKISSSGGTVDATISIPGAHYLVQSPSGNQILVFSDNIDAVVLITPGLIGVAGQPTTISQCSATQVVACILPASFNRPVGAIFDPSGATAYVINCGPECGGTTAGIMAIDMTNTGNAGSLLLGTVTLNASTTALLQGTTLYVAGTQPGSGGFLSVLNLAGGLGSVNCASGTSSNCQVFGIDDGYHTAIQMGANGRLFVGSKACSSVCLTIFDTVKAQLVPTPTNSPAGDVTGIAPIPNRNMVYVCQGTLLRVYDTTTDQLAQIQPDGQPNLAGEAVDVKVIDF